MWEPGARQGKFLTAGQMLKSRRIESVDLSHFPATWLSVSVKLGCASVPLWLAIMTHSHRTYLGSGQTGGGVCTLERTDLLSIGS